MTSVITQTPEGRLRLTGAAPTQCSARRRLRIAARLRAAGCVFAEDEAQLLVEAAGSPGDLETMAARRVAGEPVEQVLGWAVFAGHRVALDPGVFVPRRRSELLVREAVDRARPGAVVADLCCGSGALGMAVGAAVGAVILHAVDVDETAVRCARRNLAAVGGTVHQGDLFEPLPGSLRGRVHVLLANPPYVPTGAVALLPPEARLHEPRRALEGGADGLHLLRRVVAAAPPWLAPGGSLLVECSAGQAPAVAARMQAAGLVAQIACDDDLGATAVVGRRRRR